MCRHQLQVFLHMISQYKMYRNQFKMYMTSYYKMYLSAYISYKYFAYQYSALDVDIHI